ncbi:hypothetical protein IFR05_010305 [Cadophora sp. M221]|nr:hypothetical protein IFR05_010305 [Cadophora sp. M221]
MNPDNEERYRIVNHEARNAMRLVKTPDYPVNGLVELGPPDETFMGGAAKLPTELKAVILVEKFLPGPRVIRAVYNGANRGFTYRCTYPPNKLPYVIYGLGKLMKPLARTIFKAAPYMGIDVYPFFNPEIDTIAFEFLSCETGSKGSDRYINAVRRAAKLLRTHAKTVGSAPVRRIQITWCHNEQTTLRVLNSFRGIPNLEKVTLLAHDHYTGAKFDPELGDYNYLREYEYEPRDMRAMVSSGEMDGSIWPENKPNAKFRPYPFEIDMLDHNGEKVLPEDD